jgi:hypothetical protein
MVRYVVDVGVRNQQLGAVIEIHANHERTGFGRPIGRDTRQERSANLERRYAERCALFYAGERQSDIPHRLEVNWDC